MGDLSIVEKERYFECRYCDHLVSSENPVCGNCGLEMSSEGIAELSAIDDARKEAGYLSIKRSYVLMISAFMSLSFTIIGGLMSYWTESIGLFKFYFWFGLIAYFLPLILFNIELKTKFPNQTENQFEPTFLRASLFFILLSITFGAIIYKILLK